MSVNDLNKDRSKYHKPEVKKIAPDSISPGHEFVAKIFVTDTALTIANAFVDCKQVAHPSVDTVTYDVTGCSQKLLVGADTVLIAFRPESAGKKTFSGITILTKDKDGIFRTIEYAFDYSVSD